jgi:hypothetical protein
MKLIKYLLLLFIIFYASGTNPTTNDLRNYMEQKRVEEIKYQFGGSKEAENLGQLAVKGQNQFFGNAINNFYNGVKRKNYFVFSIYEIPLTDKIVIGAFDHFFVF